jgi:predicted DNA-binding transcriptional regulator YafY
MNDKVKNANNRLKILYLYKIFLDKTDEQHYLTMSDIVNQLKLYGISAGRKALYEDIEALKAYGLDIITIKGRVSAYYVASRDFELPELKLLADAVSSSRFLTEKKSSELLKKIENLSSVHEAKQIQRQVYVTNRVKAMNERIYLNVDVIHRAIAENKKIRFRYFDYNIQKKKTYRAGSRICSPYALAWDDERYYLIAYYDNRQTISNFRIDRMESVEIIDEKAVPKPENFIVADYMNSSFSMFSGTTQDVKLRFDNQLINAVIDRFGKGITIFPDGDSHFTVRVKVKAEHPEPFFGWLFQFGTMAEIIEPCELRDRYIEMLNKVLNQNIERSPAL